MGDGPIDWESFVSHKKLDISKKGLTALKGISKCKNLTWLNLSDNEIESLHWLKKMKKLVVLNASNNKISSVHQILHLEDLQALIMSNNRLKTVDGIERLSSLNTVVLSRNEIERIDVSNFTNLTKLSLSHNKFENIPDLTNLTSLKELRMNDNNIEEIPESLSCCQSLKIADLGNNKISSHRLLTVLWKLKIENLNLKGNPVTAFPDYKEKVTKELSSLKVLDGRRINCDVKGTTFPVNMVSTEDSTKADTTKAAKTVTEVAPKRKPKNVGGFVSRFVHTQETSETPRGEIEGDLRNITSRKRKKEGDVKNDSSNKGSLEKAFDVSKKPKRKKVAKNHENEASERSIEASVNKSIYKRQGETGIKEKRTKKDSKQRKQVKGKQMNEDETKSEKKMKRRKENIREEKDDKRTPSCNEEDLTEKVNTQKSILNPKNGGKSMEEDKSKVAEPKTKTLKSKDKKNKKIDKRSGVIGMEIVVKHKRGKKRTPESDVFENQHLHLFGAGENEGW